MKWGIRIVWAALGITIIVMLAILDVQYYQWQHATYIDPSWKSDRTITAYLVPGGLNLPMPKTYPTLTKANLVSSIQKDPMMGQEVTMTMRLMPKWYVVSFYHNLFAGEVHSGTILGTSTLTVPTSESWLVTIKGKKYRKFITGKATFFTKCGNLSVVCGQVHTARITTWEKVD
jgi:hypothetical protein